MKIRGSVSERVTESERGSGAHSKYTIQAVVLRRLIHHDVILRHSGSVCERERVWEWPRARTLSALIPAHTHTHTYLLGDTHPRMIPHLQCG